MKSAALLACFLIVSVASAQDVKPTTIHWYGQSFIRIETSLGKSVVIDPHDLAFFDPPPVTADVVLVGYEHPQANRTEMVKDLKAAREFRGLKMIGKNRFGWNAIDEKVGQIRIRAIGAYRDAADGAELGRTTIFCLEADGLRFAHLGGLGQDLTAEQVKAIGAVDVLMIPVGGVEVINGDVAKTIVAKLKPRLFILPMHYGVRGFDEFLPPDEFLGGPTPVRKTPATNQLAIPPEAKADGPTIVLLGWTTPKK